MLEVVGLEESLSCNRETDMLKIVAKIFIIEPGS